MQFTVRRSFFDGFVTSFSDVKYQYAGYDLSFVKIFLITLRDIARLIFRGHQKNLRNLVFSYTFQVQAEVPVMFPISISMKNGNEDFWVSRTASNTGVLTRVLSTEIEWDRIRRSDSFQGFVWYLTPEKRKIKKFRNRSEMILSTLNVIRSNFEVVDETPTGEIEFKLLNECIVHNGLFAIENNMLHYIDDFNVFETISWPTNFILRNENVNLLIANTSNHLTNCKKAVLFGSSSSWYHFLIEVLPRFLINPKICENVNTVIVRGNLPPNINLVLSHLGFSNVVTMFDGEYLSVEQLISLTDRRFDSPYIIAGRRKDLTLVRDLLLPLAKGQLSSDFVYLERGPKLFRPLYRSRKFKRSLESLGFITIRPENLSLEEQIQVFSNARVIVGESGAALTNIILMSPGSVIVEISPENNNLLWVKLAKEFDICHRMISGKNRKMVNLITGNGSYRIKQGKTIRQIQGIVETIQ